MADRPNARDKIRACITYLSRGADPGEESSKVVEAAIDTLRSPYNRLDSWQNVEGLEGTVSGRRGYVFDKPWQVTLLVQVDRVGWL